VRWHVHGERSVYESAWMNLVLTDVELPDGQRFEHHLIRFERGAAMCVAVDDEDRVLLLWRHRFATDSWGWEVPAGRMESGETPEATARREALEETGWQPGETQLLVSYHPSNGVSDQVFHVVGASGATWVGEPSDPHEAERIEWVPLDEVRRLMRDGSVRDGGSVVALLWLCAFGPEAVRPGSG